MNRSRDDRSAAVPRPTPPSGCGGVTEPALQAVASAPPVNPESGGVGDNGSHFAGNTISEQTTCSCPGISPYKPKCNQSRSQSLSCSNTCTCSCGEQKQVRQWLNY